MSAEDLPYHGGATIRRGYTPARSPAAKTFTCTSSVGPVDEKLARRDGDGRRKPELCGLVR